jgi:tRNA threonylcarbamoyl adenosine modification protein YeaZ
VKVLGLDTATSTAGIALVEDDRVLGEVRHDTSARGADLLVAVDRVCRDAGVAPGALDAIAVGAGPGSFTGLRIGMATAKGIAFAARRPLWAVSSLAALADDAVRELAELQRLTHADGVICAVLDARRGEVFAGCFRHGTALAAERVLAPAALAPWVAELVAQAQGPQADRSSSSSSSSSAAAAAAPSALTVCYAGDAIDAFRDVLGPLGADGGWLAARTPSGSAVARRALAGARVDITRAGAPTYIRPSEAEVMYPDGIPGALRRR